jgi:glutamate/tyrosine decarboxylase-like PLP-dependent enzyme
MNWLGLGMKNLVIVKCNPDGTMSLADLTDCIDRDLTAGHKPFFVNATAGTTILGAMDDVVGIAGICKKYDQR